MSFYPEIIEHQGQKIMRITPEIILGIKLRAKEAGVTVEEYVAALFKDQAA